MEILTWLLIGYFAAGLLIPISWLLHARFVLHARWRGRAIRIFKSRLPYGVAGCAMWVYGLPCVVFDQDWQDKLTIDELEELFRHEAGHLILGHARFNFFLTIAGLWWLLPWFRARQEYEADIFAASTRNEIVIAR